MNINNAEFVISAASPKDFISGSQPTIVFSGKSNVGKSSVINRLLNRKSFARVSASPGKTVHVNYFLIDRKVYFVDLPGYGFAKVSKTEKERWAALMEEFFAREGLISLGVMIVDSRHKPTADDVTMYNWFKETGCPVVVAANKLDKLKKSEVEPQMLLIRDTLGLSDLPLPFSAEKGIGKQELLGLIARNCGY